MTFTRVNSIKEEENKNNENRQKYCSYAIKIFSTLGVSIVGMSSIHLVSMHRLFVFIDNLSCKLVFNQYFKGFW